MAESLTKFLTAAWDWSERNDIPVELWRSEQGDWYVTLRMKDSRGWFNQSVACFTPFGRNNGKAAETEEAYMDRVSASMSRAAQQARAQRIKTFNHLKDLPARVA